MKDILFKLKMWIKYLTMFGRPTNITVKEGDFILIKILDKDLTPDIVDGVERYFKSRLFALAVSNGIDANKIDVGVIGNNIDIFTMRMKK